MLYDYKRWERPKADPLKGLISWLETMPANKEYDFFDHEGGCMVGQYMASVGEPWSSVRYEQIVWSITGERDSLKFSIGHDRPWTFGAALERARALAIGQRA